MTPTEQLLRETFRARAEDVGPGTDLGSQVLEAHRVQRRQRRSLVGAAAALIVLVVVVVVPLQSGRGSDPSPPASAGPAYPYPPRGSLADDPEFMAAVLRAPWGPGPKAMDPPLETRQVVFAGDVLGERWARVIGVVDGELYGVWFGSRRGQDDPDTPSLLEQPVPFDPSVPDSWSDLRNSSGPAVIVARPGDQIAVSECPVITAQGEVRHGYRALPTEDGVLMLGLPVSGPCVSFRTIRDGTTGDPHILNGRSQVSDPWVDAEILAASTKALGEPDTDLARNTLSLFTSSLGLDQGDLDLAVLWAGEASAPGLVLTATLPTGAVALVGTCGDSEFSVLRLMEFHPAGTDPDDLLAVMSCPNLSQGSAGLDVDHLVLIGPVGTSSFVFDEPSGTEPRTTAGSPRTLIVSGPRVAAIAEFTALDPNGNALATAGPGTVEAIGP